MFTYLKHQVKPEKRKKPNLPIKKKKPETKNLKLE
jgi:hypothetical protein